MSGLYGYGQLKSRYAVFLLNLSGLLSITVGTAGAVTSSSPSRTLYAVNEAANDRGSVSVYDIEIGRAHV